MSALSPLYRRGRLELVNTGLAALCVTLAACLVLVTIAAVS